MLTTEGVDLGSQGVNRGVDVLRRRVFPYLIQIGRAESLDERYMEQAVERDDRIRPDLPLLSSQRRFARAQSVLHHRKRVSSPAYRRR